MNKIFIALIVSSFFISPLFAWTKFNENYDDKNRFEEHSYDKNSMQSYGTFIKVWTKVIYREKKDGNQMYSYKFLHEINCGARESRFLAQYAYDKNENITSTDDFMTDWRHIPPDSIVEYLMNRLCK